MLRGDKVYLRARHAADVPILDSGLYDDVETRARADSRPWRPISPGSGASPYAVTEPNDQVAVFSVVEVSSDDLAGEALLWGIDTHNRFAHLGISLLPSSRGRDLSTEVVELLCDYAFRILGLNRVQIETLADNAAMIRTATSTGFVLEGTLRRSAWVDGAFVDEVVLGRLAR